VIEEGFPYADSLTLSEAPLHCLRCGGVWREVDEGYCCRGCGRRWRSADKLRDLVSRVVFRGDRYPTPREEDRRNNGPR